MARAISLNELKATQDWFVTREIKQVSGIIDVASFGGTTREYLAEIDPASFCSINVTLPQVVNAIGPAMPTPAAATSPWAARASTSAASACCRPIPDMQNVLISERNGVPVYLRDVADVHEGFSAAPRPGRRQSR